jgi:hypothetical protein
LKEPILEVNQMKVKQMIFKKWANQFIKNYTSIKNKILIKIMLIKVNIQALPCITRRIVPVYSKVSSNVQLNVKTNSKNLKKAWNI